jgi:hypothetical protein
MHGFELEVRSGDIPVDYNKDQWEYPQRPRPTLSRHLCESQEDLP